MAEWAAAPGGAGRVGRRSQVTLREAAIGVLAERRARLRGPGVRLAVPRGCLPDQLTPEEVATLGSSEIACFREPYTAKIELLRRGEPVTLPSQVVREACHRARRPMPGGGRVFLLSGDNDLTEWRTY